MVRPSLHSFGPMDMYCHFGGSHTDSATKTDFFGHFSEKKIGFSPQLSTRRPYQIRVPDTQRTQYPAMQHSRVRAIDTFLGNRGVTPKKYIGLCAIPWVPYMARQSPYSFGPADMYCHFGGSHTDSATKTDFWTIFLEKNRVFTPTFHETTIPIWGARYPNAGGPRAATLPSLDDQPSPRYPDPLFWKTVWVP